jgi:hypothetical protein
MVEGPGNDAGKKHPVAWAMESGKMKIIALIAALLMTTLAASGEDVPFAAPSLPRPGEPDTSNLVSLGDIMGETQLRHIKLWYAGTSGDWDLIRYEVDRIAESLKRAATLYANIPVEYVKSAEDPLIGMRDAVATRNNKEFVGNYAELTAACNACHLAGHVGFIRIQTPTSSPFSDEVFGK